MRWIRCAGWPSVLPTQMRWMRGMGCGGCMSPLPQRVPDEMDGMHEMCARAAGLKARALRFLDEMDPWMGWMRCDPSPVPPPPSHTCKLYHDVLDNPDK